MIQLPQAYRDPAFQRRMAMLERVEALEGRSPAWWALLAQPWVSDHPFRPNTETHCQHGHSHDAEVLGPVGHQGRSCMRRRCRECGSTWLEPVDPVDPMPYHMLR